MLKNANVLRKMIRNRPPIACRIKNIRQFLSKKPTRFMYFKDKNIYAAHEGSALQYFSDQGRGFGLYRHGLEARSSRLLKSYLIEKITFEPNDLIIDCGANYGDLYMALSKSVSRLQYVSFEPSPKEFECLVLNAPNADNNNIGLANTTGRMSFYLKTSSADSSLIAPISYDACIEVKTMRLDDFVLQRNIKRIRLFKLEAEGFEPEILLGAEKSIKICDYIAIDGGPERGESQEETFSAVATQLMSSGFDLVGMNFSNGRGLFKRHGLEEHHASSRGHLVDE